MHITLQGTNLELSQGVRDFVMRKLEDCLSAFGDMDLEAVTIDVELERTTRRHPKERSASQQYRAEANVSMPGRFLRAEGTGPTLNRAVVHMKHRLTRDIRQWREKLITERRAGERALSGRPE